VGNSISSSLSSSSVSVNSETQNNIEILQVGNSISSSLSSSSVSVNSA